MEISGQFKRGALVTESPHPVTANLSDVARRDIARALKLLFNVDDDVVKKISGVRQVGRGRGNQGNGFALAEKRRADFFTGCGATGRLSILLDSAWRDFWQRRNKPRSRSHHGGTPLSLPGGERDGARGASSLVQTDNLENRTFSVMAGGDYALIRSVEGFEDFAVFGRKQIRDLHVRAGDIVFAITEGGETSFVIGTAWAGVDAGAKVYFVYNNPDEILCERVESSREIIEDTRIEKINLTTGPMAIAGSTWMQATSIQLCVLLTILEMVIQELILGCGVATLLSKAVTCHRAPRGIPAQFFAALEELHKNLKSAETLAQLAKLVALEESVYRTGHKINYLADRFGIDMLTDTTERSPTFCTAPFCKAGDHTATES